MSIGRNWADKPVGMHDVYPHQAKLRRQVEDVLLHFFASHGYDFVSCGTFEYVETLLRGRPAQEADAWVQLFDASNRALALRPDMTPSIARMAAPLVASGETSIKWSYAERVYRRTSDPTFLSWLSGKAAESTQVGVEWIGDSAQVGDAILLRLCQQSLLRLGVENWQVVVSHAVFAPAFFAALGISSQTVKALLACLAQGDYVGFRQTLDHAPEKTVTEHLGTDLLDTLGLLNPFDESSLTPSLRVAITASPHADQTLSAWQTLTQLAQQVVEMQPGISFDLTLYRDVTYYTGVVFEVFAPGVGAPIAAGGRYDTLLRHFGANAPAVGFMYEVERLLTVLTEGAWLNGHAQTEVGSC